MDPVLLVVIALVVGALAGAAGGYVIRGVRSNRLELEVEQERLKIEALRKDAEKQAAEMRRQAQIDAEKEAEDRREKLEKELTRRRAESDRTEARLKKREEQIDRRDEAILRREESVEGKEKRAEDLLKKADSEVKAAEERHREVIRRCEEVSGLSAEEARKLLLQELEKDVRQDAAALVRRLEQETREVADKKARQLVTLAIQKVATDHVSETTVSVVNLPSDEMKGRIIGREGRNIRALEQATGVNFIVDDTP